MFENKCAKVGVIVDLIIWKVSVWASKGKEFMDASL